MKQPACTTFSPWQKHKWAASRWVAPTRDMRILFTYCLMLWIAGTSLIDDDPAAQDSPHPQLGDNVRCVLSDTSRFAISRSQFAKGCYTSISAVRFFIGTIDEKVIDFVSTQDLSFRTPEGIHVGCSLRDVLAVGGTDAIEEPSWARFSRLPSGWCARLGEVPGLKIPGLIPTSCDSTVYSLFQRR